jgi:hypothetical protein
MSHVLYTWVQGLFKLSERIKKKLAGFLNNEQVLRILGRLRLSWPATLEKVGEAPNRRNDFQGGLVDPHS